MKKRIITLSIIVCIFLCSCHYQKDRLTIINNSEKTICYLPVLHDKRSNSFYGISISGKIEKGENHSPSLIGSISNKMQKMTSDGTLYIVFFDEKDLNYVFEHENTIVFNNNFEVYKYSLKELDSLNWIIEYKKKPNG